MSPDYDPRRSRPRPLSDPDPEAAPVEALFGPEPADTVSEPAGSPVDAGNGTAPRPAPGPRTGAAPSFIWQLAPLMALMALFAAVVWWLTRRRHR